MSVLLGPIAMLLGMVLTTQVASNKLLGESLDNLYIPAAVNMLAGMFCTGVLCWAVTKEWPSQAMAQAAPWWTWLAGGVLGTIYLTGNIVLAPKLGAAALVGFVVAGQLIWAVALDHFGWIGFEQHPAGFRAHRGLRPDAKRTVFDCEVLNKWNGKGEHNGFWSCKKDSRYPPAPTAASAKRSRRRLWRKAHS